MRWIDPERNKLKMTNKKITIKITKKARIKLIIIEKKSSTLLFVPGNIFFRLCREKAFLVFLIVLIESLV
jgi:hypothetical protein